MRVWRRSEAAAAVKASTWRLATSMFVEGGEMKRSEAKVLSERSVDD